MLSPRSHCPHCLYVLSPQQLIPIVSYIKNAGKCSMCRKNLLHLPVRRIFDRKFICICFFRLNMTLELIVILTFVSF
ncbi:prepilin peptidase [Priestia megaterium]